MGEFRRRLPADRKQRLGILLRLLPLVLFFAATVGAGLLHGALQSLGLAGPPALNPDRGSMSVWYGYRELFMRPELLASILYTLYVACVSALIAVGTGAVGAYLLWRAPDWVRSVGVIYRVPIILPHIVVAYIVMLLWSRTGIIASLSYHLGVTSAIEDFPQLLYSRNGVGIIMAYVYKEFPFVMLLTLGVLERIPGQMVTTAYMLGAGPVRTFVRVILPMLGPMLNQLFIILFLYALGGFDIPWLLDGSRPQMIPMTVYSLYFQGSLADRSIAMASLTLLAAIAIAFVVVYSRIARRLSIRERPL